jgi:prephenate dehydrogenase
MNKITIIGLGLVGNSMGMGLKKAFASGRSQAVKVVGFDPDRAREEAALRKYFSVDEIAPDLESAVRGAQLVVIATPASAVKEVLGAVAPFLDEGATVTDTLSTKEQVVAWAGELLNNFVGGHPVSRVVDIETADELEEPRADLFAKAPYCIMPLPSASSQALNSVISLAEALSALPLFIDPREHDSFFAAVSNLPVLASAAFLDVTSGSPSWDDMRAFAREQFRHMAGPLAMDPASLHASLISNRQAVLYWLDNYLLALQDLGDLLAKGDSEALLALLEDAHGAREGWLRSEREAAQSDDSRMARRPGMSDEMRAELNQALEESRPSRRLLGGYLTGRVFGKKEK